MTQGRCWNHSGESILDKYSISMTDRAVRDIDSIYEYISKSLLEPATALSIVNEIESSILGLDIMPHRCPERRVGKYANKGYRQLFIKNYTAVFRIDEQAKQVIIVTVRYSRSQF